MANEATIIERYGHNSAGEVMPFTVSVSTLIPKGSLMVLSATPRTATIHASVEQLFVGIASAEKDADDSSTQLGVITNCVAEVASSGTINDGDRVVLENAGAGANFVMASNACTDSRKLVGMALSDAASNRVVVRVLK